MPSSAFDIIYNEDHVILVPKSKVITQTLVFLHGWGESGPKWVDYFLRGNVTPENTKIVLPTAPNRYTQFYKKEAPAWVDFYTLNYSLDKTSEMFDEKTIEESLQRITKILDKEIEALGGDSKRCFIGGFSLGCFMSSVTWRHYTKPLAGLIAYSMSTAKTFKVNKAQEFTPVFWSHGMDDILVPYRHGVNNNSMLNDGKRRFVHITREGLGHGVDEVVQIETRRFMEDCLTRPKL